MGMTIDDSVKQKLLNSLAEEPPMVLSAAYVYAKNYVEYGEDITKAWTTAVQQASIIQQIKVKAQAEAYNSFKKDYETHLKTDLVDILDKIRAEIEMYEADCRLQGGSDECEKCNSNVFGSIYRIIDKYKAESGE